MEKMYRISEFAKLIGVSPQTLRNWDEKGILSPAIIKESGYRYYTESQLEEWRGETEKGLQLAYCKAADAEDKKLKLAKMRKVVFLTGAEKQIFCDIDGTEELTNFLKSIFLSDVDKLILEKDSIGNEAEAIFRVIAEYRGCKLKIIQIC